MKLILINTRRLLRRFAPRNDSKGERCQTIFVPPAESSMGRRMRRLSIVPFVRMSASTSGKTVSAGRRSLNCKKTITTASKTSTPNLTGIGTVPGFAIGQRALLVQTPNGNVLWDCISLLDDATVEAVRALGGISAMAVSHPHTVGSLVEWSHAFENAPIYWHADNRRLGDATRPGVRVLGRRDLSTDGWHDPDPLRRSLRRLDGPALVTAAPRDAAHC